MYPTQVETNEKTILKLLQVLKAAYKNVVSEISTATDFGVANRKAILGQIENTLEELGENVDEFIKAELPEYYRTGADDAVRQLNNAGAKVSVPMVPV